MKRSYRRYRAGRRWLIALGLVAVVLIHLVIVARSFLSPEQFRFRTQTLLQRHFPGKVSIGEAGYELATCFRLGDLELLRADDEGGGPLFRAKALRVDWRLLPALRGRAEVDDVVFEEPELFLTAAEWAEVKRPAAELPELQVRRIVWRAGQIHFGKGALFDDSPEQELRAVNAELTKSRRLANAFGFEGSADSDLWGRCDLEGTLDLAGRRLDVVVVARGIALDERVRALVPPAVQRALDRYNAQGAVDVTVEASVGWGPEATRTYLATIAFCDCRATYERFPLLCTDIRGRITFDGSVLRLHDLEGRAGPAELKLSGRTTLEPVPPPDGDDSRRTLRERTEVDLVARGVPLDDTLYAAVSQHRTLKGTQPLKQAWDRCGLAGGTIDLEYHCSVDRVIRPRRREKAEVLSRRWQDSAEAHVFGARATYRKFPYPVEGIEGTVRRENRVTYIERLTGRRGNTTVQVDGSVTDRGAPKLHVEAIDVPFDAVLRQALDALPERTQQVYDELQPQGKARIDCWVTSPGDDPETGKPKRDYRLEIRPEGASFQHEAFPHRIEAVRGGILVDERGGVTLRDLRGRLGAIPLQFGGTVSMGGKGRVCDITVTAPEVDLARVPRAILGKGADAAFHALQPSGVARYTCHLATDPETGQVARTGKLEALRDCSVLPVAFPVRVEQLIGRVFIEPTGRTTFTGVKGHVAGAAVEALQGEYAPGAEGGLRFTLRARGLALDESVRRALPERWQKVWQKLRPSGEADVTYRQEPSPDDPKRPHQWVTIEPTNAAFAYEKLPVAVTDVSAGKITVDPAGNATVSSVQGKVRGKTVQLSGAARDGVLSLEVRAAELTLDNELLAAIPATSRKLLEALRLSGTIGGEATVGVALKTGAVEQCRLRAMLKGCQATWAKLPVPLTGLRGEVEYADGTITLRDVVGRARVADEVRLDGQVSGGNESSTRLRLRARNVRLVPELREALPPAVRDALDTLGFQGALDIQELTLTHPAAAKAGSECFAVAVLRDCAFKRTYAFEQVNGEVCLDRGVLGAEGPHGFAGSLRQCRLRVRGFDVTGLSGRFHYRTDPGEKATGATLHLTDLAGSFYGGRLSGKVSFALAEGGPFQAVVGLTGADFRQLAKEALKLKRVGQGSLALRLDFPPGRYTEPKGLVGDGWVLITRGELGDLPIPAAIFGLLDFRPPDRSLTRADMHFGIARDHLEVKELLLGRDDALFTTGSGTIGFDGALKLGFITPKRGLIQNLIGIGVDSLVRYEVRGTVGEPKPNPRPLPITQTILDEFKRGFGIWSALTGGRSKDEANPP